MKPADLALLLIGALAILLIAVHFAYAKNANGQWDDAPFHEWYSAQHNSAGLSCCDWADAEGYDRAYTLNADGSVTLEDGTVIPQWKVLTGPNPTGHPVLWHIGEAVFCFALGTLM